MDIFISLQEQINIREQMPKYLNGPVKLLTTRCIIIETEKISKKTHAALTILKQYGIHECGHKEPVSGSKCILSMVAKGNANHYILASQDRDLQEKLRMKAGVPLLYLHNKAPTLEKPSKASYDKINVIQNSTHSFISENQNVTLKKMKKALGIVDEVEEQPSSIRKKKKHNPNPLSCKKKKKKPGVKGNKDVTNNGKVRKRSKKKLPKYLKEHIGVTGN